MKASSSALLSLLRPIPRCRLGGLLGLMCLASASEGVGIMLLVPLLGLLGAAHGGNAGRLAALGSLGLPLGAGTLLAAFVVLVVLRSLVVLARDRLRDAVQHQLVDGLRQQCFAALLRAEWRWLLGTRRADHANLLVTDINRIGLGLGFALSLGATALTIIVFAACALALAPQLTAIAVAGGCLALLLMAGQRRHALQLGRTLGQASRDLHGNIEESLAGIKLTKVLGTEQRHLDAFATTLQALRRQQLAFVTSNGWAQALFQCCAATMLAAFLYLGLSVLKTPLPELLTLVAVFGRAIPLFLGAQQQWHQWLHALPALHSTQALLQAARQAAEPGASDAPLPPLREAITLEDLGFAYPEREQPALAGITLRLPRHTTTAIMGHSGAGKSTLADLLMGLLPPDRGRICLDGRELSEARRRTWRKRVAYVPQETFLFHDSIRANLRWGDAGADDERLEQALRRAAADFVFRLPRGLDTVVGDGGVRLSGGERQRLALARALLREPELLILDEATSALDLETEARVRQAIEGLHGNLTVVVIGHRLPTLEHADQVVVLDQGRIKTLGSWAEIRTNVESRHE